MSNNKETFDNDIEIEGGVTEIDEFLDMETSEGFDDILDTDVENEEDYEKDEIKAAKRNKRRFALRGRKRKKAMVKWLIVASVALLVVLVVALVLKSGVFTKDTTVDDSQIAATINGNLEEIPEGIPENTDLGSGILNHIYTAGYAVEEAFKKRPPMVTLTDANKDTFVKIDDCVIDSGKVVVNMSSEGIPKSDDKYYYLFAINSYDDAFDSDNYTFLNKVYKDSEASMSCALNAGSADTRLYKKYGVAVKMGDKYELVSTPSFITNPEAIAPHTGVFMPVSSKKGILIDYSRLYSGELEDLGVKQIAMNIPISSILGPTTNPMFPTVHYTYNGKSYSFNGVVLAGFDSALSSLSSRGIQITAILLNDYTNAYIDIIHPDARSKGSCPYYMFNGSTEAGVEMLSAVGSFLADRYSGSKHGRISNWVIANEINARKEWNFLKYTDVETYSQEFAKGFRVLYTAIKSTSSSARVFISLDQTWDRNLTNSGDYDGKDVLDCFNSYISKYGNIDWSLAYHPYNVPLTSCNTWASSKYIKHNAGSPMISMQNIEVLVNYMNQGAFLSPNGDCRSIMITELGYTSTAGEALQAAAIAYAFYKVDYYKDIDGLLLNRETDDPTEIAQGLATGITKAGGGHKQSYNVFKYMDTAQREEYLEFAKSIIGITDWKQIIY